MSIASHIMGLMYHLPPARHGVRIERDIPVPSPDGKDLMTDVYFPDAPGPHPTLLMRTPYGRTGFGIVAEAYAERGFITILQACRGTDGSGGMFDPLINERRDGLATLDWIKTRDWFDGRLGLTGPSYLGYAQWAVCDKLPQGAAMAAKVTSADFRDIVFPGGSFALQLWLSWLQTIHGLDRELFGMTLRIMTGDVERRTLATADTLPLAEADIVAVGEKVPFWRDWFSNAIGNDEFWKKRDHKHRLNSKTPPNCFVSGWYDIMVDQHIEDYRRLVRAGATPHLTIGPWFHTDNDLQGECLRQTISWMSAHLLGQKEALRKKPVRIHISGLNEWHDFDSYPLPIREHRPFFLGRNGTLAPRPDTREGADAYTYDPADPTPNVAGAIFAFMGAGKQDNSELEARPDVLTYTSAPLSGDLTVIGNVKVRLHVRSSLENTDFFARLCDVDKKGVSYNICDALIRMEPGKFHPDGTGATALDLTLHATAHTFRTGHRIRLQVSSGAHPRFARNLGTGDPVGAATRMLKARQTILFGKKHPSSLTLPLCEI